MRPRTWLIAALLVLALVVAVRVSGWSPIARDALPVTGFAATSADDRGTAQTLAHGGFEAAGGAFAWEVFGFPELRGTGVHAFQYRVHRTGGEPARIWPEAALLLDARGDNLGEGDLEAPAGVENGVLVIRQGFAPRGPGVYDMTAVLRLHVARDVAMGYLVQDPLEISLPFRIESVDLAAATASEREAFMSEESA